MTHTYVDTYAQKTDIFDIIYLSIYLFINSFIILFIYLFIYHFIYFFIYFYLYFFIYIYTCLLFQYKVQTSRIRLGKVMAATFVYKCECHLFGAVYCGYTAGKAEYNTA